MRVLLTEDEQELRSILVEALIEADYEVVEAASGDEAVLLLDCPNGFDVLVTDIHMPGRLNGLALGRRFRARYTRSPILYMTGRPDAMRGVRLDPDREVVLFKPYRLLVLVATVQALLATSMQNPGNSGLCCNKRWRMNRAHALSTSDVG